MFEKMHLYFMKQCDGCSITKFFFPVRELTTSNNILLMDLGSGPIMKASSGDHGAAHMGSNIPPDSGIGNAVHILSVTENYHTQTPKRNGTA